MERHTQKGQTTVNPATATDGNLYSSLATDPDLGELVEMFVSELPARIQTLTEQDEAGDLEGLRRTAHQLRGSAGSYGFDEITQVAGLLEHHLVQGSDSQEIAASLEALVSLCRRARAGTPPA